MHIAEAVKISLQSLWANKLRSVLTLLSVVIAIASVIAVLTFVSGINRYITEKVFNLGTDVFIINKRTSVVTNIDQLLEGERRKDITLDDYQAISEGCDRCSSLGAVVTNYNGHVKYGEQSVTGTFLRGMTPSMPAILNIDIGIGRMLNDGDVNNRSEVAVIGTDIVDNLFAGLDPLDKEIRVEGQTYRVIGVGKKQGTTLGQSRDNYVMVPLTSYLKQFGAHNSLVICGKASGVGSQLDAAMDQARVILRARRHDQPGKPDSFAIETNDTFLTLWASISDTLFISMVAIAAISLVVAGIVVMNIMLVAVTERTREIGVRKALGARARDVLLQFLIESCTVALVGGALGVPLALSVAAAVTVLIGIPSAVKLWFILAAMFVAAGIGVFFGVYPARRAAKLDPIAALRFEL